MRRAASALCFLVSAILLLAALREAIIDMDSDTGRIAQESRDLSRGDDAALEVHLREHDEAQRFIAFEGICGVVFLIAGGCLTRGQF